MAATVYGSQGSPAPPVPCGVPPGVFSPAGPVAHPEPGHTAGQVSVAPELLRAQGTDG